MFEDFQKKIRITRQAASDPHDLIVGFAHYFPLSLLPDDFWDVMSDTPTFRVTDGMMNELPIQVLDLNVISKTGALWIRDNKSEDAKAYWIHYQSATTTTFDTLGPYAATAVWSDYDDAIPLNEDPANNIFFNHKTLGLTGSYSANTGDLTGCHVNSHLEMKANFFPDSKDSQVVFGAGTFNIPTTEKTFFFLVKPTKLTGGFFHLFGNWRDSFVGQMPWRVIMTAGPGLGVMLGEAGLGWLNITQEEQIDDFTLNDWHLVAIRYGFGFGGIQLDLNGVNRVMEESEGLIPSDNNSAIRPVGGAGLNSSDAHLSMIQTYDGDLDKAQRDVWFLNWFSPADFWKVTAGEGVQVCISSPMEKNLCLSSHIDSEICLHSPIKK